MDTNTGTDTKVECKSLTRCHAAAQNLEGDIRVCGEYNVIVFLCLPLEVPARTTDNQYIAINISQTARYSRIAIPRWESASEKLTCFLHFLVFLVM